MKIYSFSCWRTGLASVVPIDGNRYAQITSRARVVSRYSHSAFAGQPALLVALAGVLLGAGI